MKQCSLFGSGPWPFIFLPLLLMIPLLFDQWDEIETDVATIAQKELVSIGAMWAKAETTNRGRNVLITGTPPSQAAIDIVRNKILNAYGVNAVDFNSNATLASADAEQTIEQRNVTLLKKNITLETLNTSMTSEHVAHNKTLKDDTCQRLVDELYLHGKVSFASASAIIQESSNSFFEHLTLVLLQCSDVNLVISGHSDALGNPESNRRLSEQRAQAVMARLISFGLSQTRLTAIGYGPNKPIADNDTAIGRAKNRRIDLHLRSDLLFIATTLG